MKIIALVSLLLATSLWLTLSPGFAADPDKTEAPTALSAADRDWEAYRKITRGAPGKAIEEMSPFEQEQWFEQRSLRQREAGLAFLERYPADPRRWRIVWLFCESQLRGHPRFVTDWGPLDAGGVPGRAVVDEAAAARWAKQVEGLLVTMATAPDLPDDLREWVKSHTVLRAVEMAVGNRGGSVALAPLRNQLLEFLRERPDYDLAEYLVGRYAIVVESSRGLTNLPAELSYFTNSPSASVAKAAREKLAFCEFIGRPIDLRFTAVDGRVVDLKELRGKVVLLDFWATWCGPCVAELPSLKRHYEEYRARGFEVVGIALENAELDPGDTPDAKAAKLTKARERLSTFLSRRMIPWPQHFDGLGFETELVGKFAVPGIPMPFLFDQQGRFVTSDVLGDKLRPHLERMLKKGDLQPK